MISPYNTVATCTGRDALRFCGSCVSHAVRARGGASGRAAGLWNQECSLSVPYIFGLPCNASWTLPVKHLQTFSGAVVQRCTAAAAAACRMLLDTPAGFSVLSWAPRGQGLS